MATSSPAASRLPTGPQDTHARVISFDLSDPSAPRVTGQRTVDGGAISTREYADGTVRVVVTTGYPPLDFVQPNRDRTPREATRANKEIVRAAPIDAWLPSLRSDGGAEQPLVDCASVRHPRTASGFGTISLLTFPFDDPDSLSATAVTAAGDLVYSSADRLYVATTDVAAGPIPRDLPTDRHVTRPVRVDADDAGARLRARRHADVVRRVGVVPRPGQGPLVVQ